MASRAGSPNRSKHSLLARLKEQYGKDFDPVMRMAKNAHEIEVLLGANPDPTPDDHVVAINAWDKIAKYTTPQLKAVEVSGTLGVREITQEEWLDTLEGIEGE